MLVEGGRREDPVSAGRDRVTKAKHLLGDRIMLLRTTSPLRDWTGEAAITTRHPASSHGRPVLLIEGEPVGPVETDWADYEILKATAGELELLRRGDYRFRLQAW